MRRLVPLLLILAILTVTLPLKAPPALASTSSPPKVICVPFHSANLLVPHETWIGKEITLKGTAHDEDGDGTMIEYNWDFGDGYSTGWVSGVDPHAIEARHTYTGQMADGTEYGLGRFFVAKLQVRDNTALAGQDTYFILVVEDFPEVRADVAIDEGLWWLHKQQSRGTYDDGVPYGYWGTDHPVSETGAVTEAFEVQGHLPFGDPNEDPYVETVQRGLNYLLSNIKVHAISLQPHGNPDVNGNGIGLGCYSDSQRTMYECGITLMTFASSLDPNRVAETGDATWVKGRTYKDIVQDLVDYLAFGQTDSGDGEGGWRYYANYGDADNSCSQWPAIGLQAAENNFGSQGVIVPDFVKTELNSWLVRSQNTDGGFLYAFSDGWDQLTSNVARTGAGCAMMAFVGVSVADARFQSALSYLGSNWYATSGPMGDWDRHFANYYAMYAVMKGMRLPEPDVVLIGSHNWYAEYVDYITTNQNSNGSWTASLSAHNPYLGSAWALLTLVKTVEKPGPIAVAPLDMKSCPPLIAIEFKSLSYHRDPTKAIVWYDWDFESDGVWDYSSAGPRAEHSYPAVFNDGEIDWDATSRTYTVTLRVRDNSEPEMVNTDTCLVTITPPPWPPISDPNGTYYANSGKTITLDGSGSYDPEERMYSPGHPWYETIATYEWDLDDDGVFDDSTEVSPEFTVGWFEDTYSVGLKVTDSSGSGPGGVYAESDWSVKYTQVVVRTGPPIAEANGPYEMVGGAVTFTVEGSGDPEDQFVEYQWDFNSDGGWDTGWVSQETQGNEFTYAYGEAKEYLATLQVRDSDGHTATDTAYVHGGPVWLEWEYPTNAYMKSEYQITLHAQNTTNSTQAVTFSLEQVSESPNKVGAKQRDVNVRDSLTLGSDTYQSGTPVTKDIAGKTETDFTFNIKHEWDWLEEWKWDRVSWIFANLAITVSFHYAGLIESKQPGELTLAKSILLPAARAIDSGVQFERIYSYNMSADSLITRAEVEVDVPEDRQNAYIWSIIEGWAAGKSTTASLVSGVTTPWGIAFAVGEVALIVGAEATYVWAADPLEDYTEIPVPVEAVIPGTEDVTDPTASGAIDLAVQYAATMQAAGHAATRAELAREDGSDHWMWVQLAYCKKYLADASQIVQQLGDSMGEFLEGIYPPDALQMTEAREQLASAGLPQIEEAGLAAFGLTGDEIQEIENGLIENTPEVYFRCFVDLPQCLSNLADWLQKTADILPGDITPPSATIIPLIPDPSNDSAPTLTGTATDTQYPIALVEYSVDGGNWSAAQPVDDAFDELSEEYIFTTDVLADGEHTVQVRATDILGNDMPETDYASDTFTVDTASPLTPNLGSPTPDSYTNNATPTLDWSDVSDPSGVSYSLQVDDSSDFSSPVINQTGLASSTYTPTSSLAEGTYYWKVKAVDGASNESDWSSDWSFTITTTAPPSTNWPLIAGIIGGLAVMGLLIYLLVLRRS